MIRADFIKELRNQGLNLIPLKPNSKEPSLNWKEYQKKKYDGFIPMSANYGVICGQISDNLLVIDIDKTNDKTILDKIIPDCLNKTLVNETGKGFHIYIKTTKHPDKTVRLDNNNIHIDIQVKGVYVVGAESIHPNGKTYKQISTTNKIIRLDFKQILKRLEKLGFHTNLKSNEPKGHELVKGGVKVGNIHNSLRTTALWYLYNSKPKFDQYIQFMQAWNQTNEQSEHEPKFSNDLDDFWKYYQQNPDGLSLTEYADIIMQSYTFKTFDDTNEILYYKDGVYVTNGEALIRSECQAIIPDCSRYKVGEIIAIIQRSTGKNRHLFNNDLSKLVLKNGVLNLDSLKLSEHDPEFLTTIKLPIDYDPKATCPTFLKFLKECLPNYQDIITVIEEAANILTTNRRNFEISSIWIGSGANGKSCASKIIRGVFGSDNCSRVSIHALEWRFMLALIYGKLANIYNDISSKELNSLGIFKQTVSNEELYGEKKNQPHFYFEPYAKHFFSANKMPNIIDDSDGAFRRIYVTKWENQFLPDINRIDDYDKIILEKEANGIFNLFLQNYKTLIRNNGFRYKQSIAKVRETIKLESDTLREYVKNCLIINPNGFILNNEFYEIYQKYCESNKYEIFGKQKLGIRLPEYGISPTSKTIKGKTFRGWRVDFNLNNIWVKDQVKGLEKFV